MCSNLVDRLLCSASVLGNVAADAAMLPLKRVRMASAGDCCVPAHNIRPEKLVEGGREQGMEIVYGKQ